jgi:hypothetical protein
MARKKQEERQFVVVKGCDTADGTRYEVGDDYFPGNHRPETTQELIDAGAIKEINGDS